MTANGQISLFLSLTFSVRGETNIMKNVYCRLKLIWVWQQEERKGGKIPPHY